MTLMARLTLKERLWAKVDKSPEPDGCWIWRASLTFGGRYGGIRDGRRMRPVHRLTYEWEYGPIPAGLELDHLCRTRRCVRPSHLEAVTHRVNMRRAIPFTSNWGGRGGIRRIDCRQGHGPLTVLADGKRGCRPCRALNNRNYRARRKQATAA